MAYELEPKIQEKVLGTQTPDWVKKVARPVIRQNADGDHILAVRVIVQKRFDLYANQRALAGV